MLPKRSLALLHFQLFFARLAMVSHVCQTGNAISYITDWQRFVPIWPAQQPAPDQESTPSSRDLLQYITFQFFFKQKFPSKYHYKRLHIKVSWCNAPMLRVNKVKQIWPSDTREGLFVVAILMTPFTAPFWKKYRYNFLQLKFII